jgi:23S rRNA pseudouridine955/2504/2580 synthase
MELITGENDKDRRLDRILRKALPDYPLPLIHKLLRQKKVLVNGKPGKADDRLDIGIKILIQKEFTRTAKQRFEGSTEEEKEVNLSELNILWENQDLIAVNKPVGLSVHGTDSLDSIVQSYLADKLPPSLSFKPGPLHRLDKPSSGIVVFSKSLEGARLFTSLMRERKIRKTYLALVEGKIEKEEIWQDELTRDKEKKKTFIAKKSGTGKDAITKITPLSFKDGYTLIKAEIETGRTHQIRAQAAAHGHPLVGDIKYGAKKIRNKELEIKNKNKVDIFLHAWKLEFLDVKIEAPLHMDTNCFPDCFHKCFSVGESSSKTGDFYK